MKLSKLLIGSSGLWENGIVIVRVVTGLFLMFHGTQMFETKDMEEFSRWLVDLHVPFPGVMPYVGKGIELLGGLCLTVGLFTKVASIFLIGTFCFITFVIGHGKIFTDDQHPFMFVLMSSVFLLIGPGKISLDHKWFDR